MNSLKFLLAKFFESDSKKQILSKLEFEYGCNMAEKDTTLNSFRREFLEDRLGKMSYLYSVISKSPEKNIYQSIKEWIDLI